MRHALRKSDALGKTIVILTDNIPLALAINQRTRFKFSSHSTLSCCVCMQPVLQHCHTLSLDSFRVKPCRRAASAKKD